MFCNLALLDAKDESDKLIRLYDRYKYFMWYIAKGVLKDDYLAEDAVHEAFITLMHHINKIDESEDVKTKSFLSAVVKCRAIDILRKRNKTDMISMEDMEEQISDEQEVLEQYISEDGYQQLLLCVSKLDEKYRIVFELKYIHGLSDRQAADIIGISDKAVNVRMFRARRKLQELIRKELGDVDR